MSKSKDHNEERDTNLDTYYQETLNETKSYILRLKDVQTAQTCRKWIERLNYAGDQRAVRNQYLGELYQRLKVGRIEGVFSRAPARGPLPPIPYQEPTMTERDSSSDSSVSIQLPPPRIHPCQKCRQPHRTESATQHEEDETDETICQDNRSDLSLKALDDKPSRIELHACKQRIDELTNVVRNFQNQNEYLNQELFKRQGYADIDELHHLRAVVKQKNVEINDWKSRLVKVQHMKDDLEECHEEIIHRFKVAINEQCEKFKRKLQQEEMKSEKLQQEVDDLTQKVKKASQEKEEELMLKQKNYEELLDSKGREFDSKYKNLEAINRDLKRKNETSEKNILLLNNRLQELENKLQLKTDEEVKLQSLMSEQCLTMREEFTKIRNEMEAANQLQNQVLTQKVSSLKKSLLKLEKSKQKIILELKQKMFEIEKSKEIEMKAMELQLQEQRNELSTSLSTEKQCELDSLVNMLEERYKGFVASTEAMADSQRQKYLQKMTELEDQLSCLKSTLTTDGTYV
ncbi:gelsolin-related protein of 125 kDa-like [Diachasmimorpha longicaudata]|uniref:gelsolin-related protein of 125 kDa-like n=1 Tax=Diachasmimorpha longicaudata TaxID=58733 RepID=UPI0030B8E91A